MPVFRTAPALSRRLTVLQVLPALESGGTERGVLEVAHALIAAGHRSMVISAGGRMVAELISHGSEHFERRLGSKSPFTLRHVLWLRRLLIDQSVDVIDVHSRMPAWVTLAAWKSLRMSSRPVLISTVHGLHSVNYYSSATCRGEYVVAVSNSVRDYIRQNYPFVPDDRLQVIPRGIEGTEFPRGYQPDDSWKVTFFQTFPKAANKKLLTLVGRVTRRKGHEAFLRLLSKLRNLGLDVHGLMVGEADPGKAAYLDEIKSLAASLNLNEHVTFTGHRSDVREIYSISAVVLSLNSTPESFGRTVAEALAIGTPVVGYNHGGVAEILAAEFPSGAVEPGDSDSLTQAVRRIVCSITSAVPKPNQYERAAMLQKTIELYEAAVKQKSNSNLAGQ